MMSQKYENLVKLADKRQRIITFRADVKTPAGYKERLYRVTLPDGKLIRDLATFEVYVSRPRRSHQTWHLLTSRGGIVDSIWEMVLETEKANV
jgi:hypothetical protein